METPRAVTNERGVCLQFILYIHNQSLQVSIVYNVLQKNPNLEDCPHS